MQVSLFTRQETGRMQWGLFFRRQEVAFISVFRRQHNHLYTHRFIIYPSCQQRSDCQLATSDIEEGFPLGFHKSWYQEQPSVANFFPKFNKIMLVSHDLKICYVVVQAPRAIDLTQSPSSLKYNRKQLSIMIWSSQTCFWMMALVPWGLGK